MEILTSDASAADIEADWLIVPVVDGTPAALDDLCESLVELGELEAAPGSLGVVIRPAVAAASRVCFVSLGGDLGDLRSVRRGIASALMKATAKASSDVAFVLPAEAAASLVREVVTRTIVAGSGQGLYQANATRGLPARLHLVGPADAADIEAGRVLGDATNLTRELVNRHAGEITPEAFAKRAGSILSEAGVEVDVHGADWMRREKFGSMLAVAQGSDAPPRLLVMRYRGGEGPLLGLCGKGVTFDSGGLSLKPSASMQDMKADMGGGATVVGAVLAAAKLKLPVNLLAVVGLVENMISGRSYRLGDVLQARNGTTIEVHNTDAEGRLVLADVLSWTVDQGAETVIDLATLTGACVVALGEDIVGLFPNDDGLASKIEQAAETAGEDVWRLPMHDSFAELLKSDVADCKNVGPRWGGAITAAKFLEKFVGEATWAHLDIAGPAFATSSRADRDGGGTGAMVATLVEWMRAGG